MIKKCLNCGNEFETQIIKKVNCSKKCNVDWWRKNNPQRYKQSQVRQNKKRKGVYRYNSKTRAIWYEQKKKDPMWKERLLEQERKRHKEVQQFIQDYKLQHGCKDCGYKEHHVALEFDHIRGEKELNVCNAKSIDQAKKEIKKCEVVCSNCHSIRTYNRLPKKD